MAQYRTETDFLGTVNIPANALYGIHAYRARENFGQNQPFSLAWYKAVGTVKKSVYLTYAQMKKTALSEYSSSELTIQFFSDKILNALIFAAERVEKGEHFEQFIVPAIQGGAGTSINMNINEIISNIALQSIGEKPGNYETISPNDHANVFQSTNDVIPTALRLAIMQKLDILENKINEHRTLFEQLEQKYRNTLRIGYTQLQQAVPATYGRFFSAFAEALSRDWWRVSKCSERIKLINLGGSAIGSSVGVPRYMLMEMSKNLQNITELPLTRSENLFDATSNLDSFVEIHATLKSHAVNLEKMSADIRLLASDLVDKKEIHIQQRQLGSSIMPAKVNPVMAEYAVSVSHQIYANDNLVSSLSGQGQLELNAYIPIIGHSILQSLSLLIDANTKLANYFISGIIVNEDKAQQNLWNSPAITTVLVPYIGYSNATALADEMKQSEISVFQANEKLQLVDKQFFEKLMMKENLLKAGFSIKK